MNFLNSIELLAYAQNQKLYVKLVQQLVKDFNRANVSINLNNEIAPKELTVLLHEKVYFLILEKFTEYLNLMYAIDVPERQFKKISSSDIVEVAEASSFLILQREFQKVTLKSKYS